MKCLCSQIFFFPLMLGLLSLNLFAQQTKDESPNPSKFSFEADVYPCRDIKLSKTVKEIDRNIIAFLNYEQGNLVSIEIKPTCDFKESRMPKDLDVPTMSERTFRRVMSKLEKLKPIGRLVESAAIIKVYGTLREYTDKYKNADVAVWGYDCADRRGRFGCGIRKFIIYYSRNAI